MDTGSILVIHFVELINKANTLVSKDQCATLEDPFSRNGVFVDASSQADCACALTRRVDNTMENLFDVFKELRLGSTRVSQKQDVDVTPDPVFASYVLGLTSEHSER